MRDTLLGGGSANPGGTVLVSADGFTLVVEVGVRPVKWSLGNGPQILSIGGYSILTSVSANGDTVAGFDSPSFGSDDLQAFRWEDSGQVFMLDSIQPGVSTVATVISADGRVISGNGLPCR
ncbi:MAG: putative membrane protein [Paracoccaceae bacterium]|jgi:uncharacterized membrane protein